MSKLFELDSLLWVKEQALRTYYVSLEDIRRDLLVQPRGFQGENPPPFSLMQKHKNEAGEKLYGLPVMYGLKTFQEAAGCESIAQFLQEHVLDLRSAGEPYQFKSNITPRDKAQERFFNDTLKAIKGRNMTLACSPTGSGKTICAVHLASQLGVATLAIVPSSRLAGQWREAAHKFLGLSYDQIGMVGGGKKEWEGKPFTVAIIHNLIDGEKLPDEFYTRFGFVCYDELHVTAAKSFSRSLLHFPARYRMGMSATPTRKDGCEKVFLYQFGMVNARGTGDALQAQVRVYDFKWRSGNGLDSKPIFVKRKIVMANDRRNNWCARMIHALYKRGRHVLVFSEEILHLQTMIGICAELGIPDKELGLYARTYYTPEGKTKTIKEADLDYVEKHCRIIFTVYAMAKDGIDIPRLDAGIDIYPRTEGIQAIGRIRRPLDGKPMPVWITIRDKGVGSLMGSCRKRLLDYKKSNCNIIECGDCK